MTVRLDAAYGCSRTTNKLQPSLALAALLFVAGVATRASAQTVLYERPQTRGSLNAFSHERGLSAFGWRRVAFPVRTARAYRTGPRGNKEERLRALAPHLAEAAALYSLPIDYLRAVAEVESGFDPRVVSVDGAMGIMQLMPFTARKMGVTDPLDPRQSVLGGARFLRIIANQWGGNLVLTTAAYNAGSGAVTKYRGIPPYKETQRYVRKVLALYRANVARPATSADVSLHPSALSPRREEG